MAIYFLAGYSGGADCEQSPAILVTEAQNFQLYDAAALSLLQAFDARTARISASRHYVQVQKVDQTLFLLFHQDLGQLLRFVHDCQRVTYSALVNGEKCRLCFEGNALCLLTFKRNVELQRGDRLLVSGGALTIQRGNYTIYVYFELPEALYECGRICYLILKRMGGGECECGPADECATRFGQEQRYSANYQNIAYSGMQQLSAELSTAANKPIRAYFFLDAGCVIVILQKGLRKRQFVLQGVNELGKTPMLAQFQLLPEREVLSAAMPVYERICSFCAGAQRKDLSYTQPVRAEAPRQATTLMYAPTPTSEEIARALKLLSSVMLSDAQGKHVQVKFSFPENVTFVTLGGQQTISFAGTRIHAEYEAAIVFYFIKCEALFTARRALYLQVFDALNLLQTARERGIDFSGQAPQKQNLYQVQQQVNQARQKALSYQQVLRQLSVAMDVQTAEEKQHYRLQFSTDGEQVFVTASQGSKAIMEPTRVQDVALIATSQQKATFKVLPIPNVLIAAAQEFYGFWTAWREFKEGYAQQ